MKNITFTGSADVRELEPADFERHGVEAPKEALRFERGVPLEVTNKVGEVLLSNPQLFGTFTEDDVELEDDRTETEREADEQAAAARKTIADSNAASTASTQEAAPSKPVTGASKGSASTSKA